MPVHNAEPYLCSAIKSVLNQTFADFELIIINDGSTDSSARTIAGFASRDPRIVALDQPNVGIVATLNKAIALARAPLLARMDADDISDPDRLRAQVAMFELRPNLAALGGHARVIDTAGRPRALSLVPIGSRQIAKATLTHCPLIHPAAMLRRAFVAQVGGYHPELEPAEDYDLWLRLLDAGYEVDNLNRVVLLYRQHDQSVSHQRRSHQALKTLMARKLNALRRAGLPLPALCDAPDTGTFLRNLPPPFRPSDAEILEAELGSVESLANSQVRSMLARLDQSVVDPGHERPAALLRLRAGLVLLWRGNRSAGLAAIADALSSYPMVIPDQLVRTLKPRWTRMLRRIQYVGGRIRAVLAGS